MDARFKALTFIIMLLSVGVFLWGNEETRIIFSPKLHKPFCTYTPYWFLNDTDTEARANFSQVKKDLDLIKDLGFKGLKLWCIEGLEYNNLTDNVFDYCEDIDLKVILPFRIWGHDEFPNNEIAIKEFTDFIEDLIPRIKGKRSLYAYVVHYPINYSDIEGYAEQYFDTIAYKSHLASLNSRIHKLDPNHEIYMALEFDPNLNPPLDVNVQGYGIEPYSWYTPKRFDVHKVRTYLGYFENRNPPLHAFIDEYGLQTVQGWVSWGSTVLHGYTYDEESKAQILHDFIIWVYDKPYLWSYFALHDTAESDWGLAYENGTLKESGRSLRDLLKRINT